MQPRGDAGTSYLTLASSFKQASQGTSNIVGIRFENPLFFHKVAVLSSLGISIED